MPATVICHRNSRNSAIARAQGRHAGYGNARALRIGHLFRERFSAKWLAGRCN
jgi:hypothetical protein